MKLKSQLEIGLNVNIHRLVAHIDHLSNDILQQKSIALTNSQYLIMKSIVILGAPTQTEIAKHLYISTSAVSRHCSILEKMNYVHIKQVSKREHSVSLTGRGEKIFDRARKLLHSKLQKKIPNYFKLAELIYSSL